MRQQTSQSGGIWFFGFLAIVFIALKLTGHISWSWWWVLAPLWGPPVIFAAVIILIFLAAFLITR